MSDSHDGHQPRRSGGPPWDPWTSAHARASGLHTGVTLYVGVLALSVNLAVTAAGTLICRWFGVRDGEDATSAEDYLADEGAPAIRAGWPS